MGKTGISPTLCAYQWRALAQKDRFCWHCWSRQSGKSFTFALKRIKRGIQRRRDQFFLSAGERQSAELMDKATAILRFLHIHHVKTAKDVFEGIQYRRLEIRIPSIGIKIMGLPANPDTIRGFSGDVFLDEFAMHTHDREIWAGILPAVMRCDGEVDVCSTPKGCNNMFHALRDNKMFAHDTLTIDDAVAQGLQVNREDIRLAIGDDMLYRQEMLCEFLDETEAFLPHSLIASCEDGALVRDLDIKAVYNCTTDIYVGVDVGRKYDLTVISPFRMVGRHLQSMGLLELFNVPFEEQRNTIERVLRGPTVRKCCIDATGMGMQLAEQLQTSFGGRVEPCVFTHGFKEEAACGLRAEMEAGRLSIPNDVKIHNDFHGVRRSVTSAGNVRLNAMREDGSHSDRFWAAALAVHAAGNRNSMPFLSRRGESIRSAGLRSI